MTDLLLSRARLGLSADGPQDVLVRDGRVAIITPSGTLGPDADTETVDLDGRTLVPGLWDHHVHVDQLALRRQWVDLAGADSPAAVAALVRERWAVRPPTDGLPLVGYGFRDALWAERPHRRVLDEVSTEVSLIMVSGDLHQGWLNTTALQQHGYGDDQTDDHDGLLREDAWYPVMTALRSVSAAVADSWVGETVAAAAARGVVGVIDYENGDNLGAWARRSQPGPLGWRVRACAWPDFLDAAIAAGYRSGDEVSGTHGRVTMGSLKVVTDGSLNTRTAYCHDPYPGQPGNHGLLVVPPEQLEPLMRRAWTHGISSAVHAIGDHANSLVLDAFAAVGASGAVEHAQLLTDVDVPRFAALGVAASVQPEHAHDDRDVADHHWAGRTGRSFPYGALHRARARLLLGSDAPVAPLDPWVTLGAAVSRSRDGREPWHPEHELPLAVALAASTAVGRTEPVQGDVADLAVVELDLATADAAQLRTAVVAGTLLEGGWTHRTI